MAVKNPPKWTTVYPQGTAEGNDEVKFFKALARHPKFAWRSVGAIEKESGLTRKRVEEILQKYFNKGMVFQSPKNEDNWGYWERVPEMLPKDSGCLATKDQQKRIDKSLGRTGDNSGGSGGSKKAAVQDDDDVQSKVSLWSKSGWGYMSRSFARSNEGSKETSVPFVQRADNSAREDYDPRFPDGYSIGPDEVPMEKSDEVERKKLDGFPPSCEFAVLDEYAELEESYKAVLANDYFTLHQGDLVIRTDGNLSLAEPNPGAKLHVEHTHESLNDQIACPDCFDNVQDKALSNEEFLAELRDMEEVDLSNHSSKGGRYHEYEQLRDQSFLAFLDSMC